MKNEGIWGETLGPSDTWIPEKQPGHPSHHLPMNPKPSTGFRMTSIECASSGPHATNESNNPSMLSCPIKQAIALPSCRWPN